VVPRRVQQRVQQLPNLQQRVEQPPVSLAGQLPLRMQDQYAKPNSADPRDLQ
jgi:hypothetical protein